MFKKFALSIIVILSLAGAAITPAFAGVVGPVNPDTVPASAETGQLVNETPKQWFVQLSGLPTSEGNSELAVRSQQAGFRLSAQVYKVKYKEHYTYSSLWNGFSITASTADLGKISRMPGVKAIFPVMIVSVPQTATDSYNPELYTALSQTGADVVQSELGYTGKGIKVAVMDTGIDYDHPAFGGDGVSRSNSHEFPTARVFRGWDFVGDAYNADDTSPSYNPVAVPDQYPDDCAGHGSHVAGIIGANDATNGLKGVAPDVKFGSYRVFGCEGSTTDAIMLAAMERAYRDGMNVLNMSIGSSFEWPQSPTAEAASRLVKKGMVVVASIGNSGASGVYSAGAPGLGENVIGVASFENTHVFLPYLEVNGAKIGYIEMTYSAPIPTSGTGEIVDVGLACSALPAGSLTGKVALAARGTCGFGIKAENAVAAGADAVLISNNVPGTFNGTLSAAPADPKPVVGISQSDGAFIRAQTAPIMMTWTNQLSSSPSPTGGLISSFSSYGLSPDLALKPDLGAPGGNIYSSYPLELGGYATLSGTSMASPHVAGTVALLLQAKPKTKAMDVRTLLQNNSVPALWSLAPSYGILDSVNRQGAGMVRIDNAILASTVVEPGKLSLGESQGGLAKRELHVTNNGNSKVTYDLSYEAGLTIGGVITPTYFGSDESVTFNKASLTVNAHDDAQVNVTISAPSGPDKGQYGGYIIFTPRGGGQVLRVPYAGFVGDYQSIQVLTQPYGLPLLTDQYLDDTVSTFTLQAGDLPYVVVHLEHQSRIFKLEAFNAVSGKSIGKILQLDYMVRNSTSTGFYGFAWDGTTTGKGNKTYTAPNGTYIVKMSVLKALGKESNPADWETWTSPVITLARP